MSERADAPPPQAQTQQTPFVQWERVRLVEDMTPTGTLELFLEPDGDVCVTVFEPGRRPATVQFCTGPGGGHAPRTRAALLELARAMAEDFGDSRRGNAQERGDAFVPRGGHAAPQAPASPAAREDPSGCQSDRDGDCTWAHCPQLRDGEPKATGRWCPLDQGSDGE